MHHLKCQRQFFSGLIWRADEILYCGLCSMLSEAFKGEMRHIMKSANWKQLTRAKKKKFHSSLAAFIQLSLKSPTLSIEDFPPVVHLVSAIESACRHVSKATLSSRESHARPTETILCDRDLSSAQALIKHLWEPRRGHLGITALQLPARAGLLVGLH